MRGTRFLLYATTAVAATLVVALGMKVRTLEESARSERERQSLPHEGLYLPTFETSTLDGRTVRIGETAAGGRQILLLFTTTCRFCEASLPAWKELAALADTFNAFPVNVTAITLDSLEVTRDYASRHELSFDIVHFPAPKLARLYRARSVPQTLVLDDEGRILYARTGVVETGAVLDSLRRAITLP